MAPGGVGHHADGLGQVRGAGGEEHHAAGAYQPDRGGEQFALQLAQRGYVGRCAPPARSGRRRSAPSPVQGASLSTQSNRLPAGGSRDHRPAPPRPEVAGVSSSTMSARRWLGSTAVTAPPLRSDRGGDQRSFCRGRRTGPASARRPHPRMGRASAQVPPAGCPRPGPVPGRHAPRPADGSPPPGTPHTASTFRACRRPRRCQVVGAEHPRPRCQMHSRSGVVGGQCDVQFPASAPSASAKAWTIQRGWECTKRRRARPGRRRRTGRVRPPQSLVPLGDGPQAPR